MCRLRLRACGGWREECVMVWAFVVVVVVGEKVGVEDEDCDVANAYSDVASNLAWGLWGDASAEIAQVSC
jgi:hypothetical protein